MKAEWTKQAVALSASALTVGLIAVQKALHALDETPFEGVTGAAPSCIWIDGVLLALVEQARASTSPCTGHGLDRLLAACSVPVPGGRNFSRGPRIRSAAGHQMKKRRPPCSAVMPADLILQRVAIVPQLHSAPQWQDCAGQP
jgi:hypothetical protein